MKVNEQRKQMYLNGEVGIHKLSCSDNELFKQVTGHEINSLFPISLGDYAKSTFHPLSWFFEQDDVKPPRTQTAWRLKVDLPEARLKRGDILEDDCTLIFWKTVLPLIATPIYTTPFTLESGQEIELSDGDIENIKKIKL